MSASASANATQRIPALESGDRLHSQEFLRRFELMPDTKKAELIDGLVFMSSPVSLTHSEADSLIQTWLGTYATFTAGISCHGNTTVILDADNTFQPDVCLIRQGGQTTVSDRDYAQGAPELVVEIAFSSRSIDTHAKKKIYQRCGVREYLVWRVEDDALDWWTLDQEEYALCEPDEDGLLESHIFPGLVLHVPALLALDGATVLSTLQNAIANRDGQGSQSPGQ